MRVFFHATKNIPHPEQRQGAAAVRVEGRSLVMQQIASDGLRAR
jgi:hypothetical protein